MCVCVCGVGMRFLNAAHFLAQTERKEEGECCFCTHVSVCSKRKKRRRVRWFSLEDMGRGEERAAD